MVNPVEQLYAAMNVAQAFAEKRVKEFRLTWNEDFTESELYFVPVPPLDYFDITPLAEKAEELGA